METYQFATPRPTKSFSSKTFLVSITGILLTVFIFVVALHDPQNAQKHPRTTELFNDIGGRRVEGFTCGRVQPLACSPIGGSCEGFFWPTCTCRPGYSGYDCDWGPKTDDETYSTEELARYNMAYSFAAGIYDDTRIFLQKCPGFNQHLNASGVINVHNIEASTFAGGAYIPPEKSPSGQPEIMFGFRGTMFTAAMQELAAAHADNADINTLSFDGLQSVLTDANVARHDIQVNISNTMVDVGYVHKGFFDAVVPFLDTLLPAVHDYVQAIQHHAASNRTVIITITGHSLGAALAQIFASVVRVIFPEVNLHVVTFGSPRVGSPLWVSNFVTPDSGGHTATTTLRRFVNGDDVVTLVPTAVGLGDSLIHAGRQTTLDFAAVSSDCSGMVDINSQFSLVAWMSCAVHSASAYHLQYRPKMSAFLSNHGFSITSGWCNADAELGF